jgi:hypothetical protein
MRTSKVITDRQWWWLRANYLARGSALTTMELARVAKYETHHGVNRWYGQFGADLAHRLGWAVPAGAPFASAFATFSASDLDDPNTVWTLRPEVVAAIDRLGWFPRPAGADNAA